MNVLSWNVWCGNQNTEDICIFLLAKDSQVICLQEVNQDLLKQLKNMPGYDLVYCVDSYFRGTPNYLVILSKHRIVKYESIPILRNRSFSLVSKIFGWDETKNLLYCDIETEKGIVRVFCLHLEAFTTPSSRIGQFALCLNHLKSNDKNIICGDFNIFGNWYKNIFVSWIFKYSYRDIFSDERKEFESMFRKLKFVNIFSNRKTNLYVQLQLDHILLPERFEVLRKEIEEQTYGSDHKALYCLISIPDC